MCWRVGEGLQWSTIIGGGIGEVKGATRVLVHRLHENNELYGTLIPAEVLPMEQQRLPTIGDLRRGLERSAGPAAWEVWSRMISGSSLYLEPNITKLIWCQGIR